MKAKYASVASLVLMVISGFGYASNLVYENDFSTRTSAPLPSDAWLELSYAPGRYLYNYKQADCTSPDFMFSRPSEVQDGWRKMNCGVTKTSGRDYSDYAAGEVTFTRITNCGYDSDTPDPNSYIAVWASWGCDKFWICNSLNNSFSTGTLRFSIDMRAPSGWYTDTGYTGSQRVDVRPIFESYLDGDISSRSLQYATAFGISDMGNSTAAVVSGSGAGSGLAKWEVGNTITKKNWYRMVVDLHLDASTYDITVYDFGSDHPALNQSLPAVFWSVTNCGLCFRPNAANGGVAGFALCCSCLGQNGVSTDWAKRSPCFDNITAAWKAPGSDEFVSCYENDFSTRRYRTISPVGAASATYDSTRDSTVVSTVANPVASGTFAEDGQLLPTSQKLYTGVEPIGVDGWRRANCDGTTSFGAVPGNQTPTFSYNDGGGTKFRFWGDYQFGIAVCPFGSPVTSGKVRFEADVRTPKEWRFGSRGNVSIGLGGRSWYEGGYAECTAYAVQAGMAGTGAAFHPFYAGTSGTVVDETVSGVASTWYRVILVADVDNRTFDCTMYAFGKASPAFDQAPTNSAFYTVSGVPWKTDGSELSTIGLFAYGPGGAASPAYEIQLDNLKVYRDAGTASERLIYQNTADASTRWLDEAPLAGNINLDNGQDHWIRRGAGLASSHLTGGTNPCVAQYGSFDSVWAVQSLGTNLTEGTVCVTCDVRPPSCWRSTSERFAMVGVGDDVFLQGNGNAQAIFTSDLVAGFGFGDRTGVQSSLKRYNDVSLRVMDANAPQYSDATVNTKHWYRFQAKIRIAEGVYSVKVYDMGASHPAAGASAGSLVCTFSDLQLGKVPVGGISSLGLASAGNELQDSANPEGAGNVLFDNLKVTASSGGMVLIFR